MKNTKIIVIGSSNTDMVAKTSKIPALGETVLGGEFIMTDGGKGANQAVTVSRLGGDLTFVAKVGEDIFGDQSIERYKSYGIDTQYIFRDQATSSGIALIMVDENGENCISVASGANNKLSKNDIDSVRKVIEKADILLTQLETPLETIKYVVELAYHAGVKVILNPAPAQYLSKKILERLYLITPNEIEAQLLSGIKIKNIEDAKRAAQSIVAKGATNVIITLGAEGSLIFTEDKEFHFIKAHKVKAIDTTAAGDVYNGALCVALSEGKNIVEAVEFATAASAIAVTRMGAQISVPIRSEVDELIINKQIK